MARSWLLNLIEQRHYKIGKCIMALKCHGDLSSVELGKITDVNPRGLRNLLNNHPDITFDRRCHSWFYESTGVKTNLTVKRDILYFSLVEA